ncbi:MAG TPA: hypothetical protein VKF17_18080 [Isosphaeraceae bacterium]|nr:hypothetical protein [Isosphaeraceae bacterium]
MLMMAAGRFLDLGCNDEARTLVDEALALARTVDARDERLGSTRPTVGSLARLIVARALSAPDPGFSWTWGNLRSKLYLVRASGLSHFD